MANYRPFVYGALHYWHRDLLYPEQFHHLRHPGRQQHRQRRFRDVHAARHDYRVTLGMFQHL